VQGPVLGDASAHIGIPSRRPEGSVREVSSIALQLVYRGER
jgi:hypothetical protein